VSKVKLGTLFFYRFMFVLEAYIDESYLLLCCLGGCPNEFFAYPLFEKFSRDKKSFIRKGSKFIRNMKQLLPKHS